MQRVQQLSLEGDLLLLSWEAELLLWTAVAAAVAKLLDSINLLPEAS
jgi:hypothetical protein